MQTLSDVLSGTGETSSSPVSNACERLKREADNKDPSKALELWSPLPGPQTEAYESEADILFMGGAAGGGKTFLLLGLAVTAHRNSIIFRRELQQMRGPEGIIEQSREIIGGHGNLNQSTYSWRGLPNGRKIEFGYCKHEHDKEKYKGRAHDLKAFDEVTEFSESQFRFLIAWNRTTLPNQRCRVVCTGNPPTDHSGRWVIDYWAPWLDSHHPNPADPGELRWFASVDGEDVEVESGEPFEHKGETIKPLSRTFIPAKVEDNPYLMDTGYRDILASLPEPLRSQLLEGNFEATQEDDPWQVIPTEWILAAQRRWREQGGPACDLTSIGADIARGGRDKMVIARMYGNYFDHLRKIPGKAVKDGQAAASLIMSEIDDPGVIVGVDIIGVGYSAFDFIKETHENSFGLNGAEKSAETDRSGKLGFVNKRAEWWWGFREALDPDKGDDICLPPDPELLADLCAPRWKIRSNRIQIEDKDEIKKRIGRSPDCGDTVVYAAARTESQINIFI